MTFGDNIKRIRKEKGMSQQSLGNKLGVKQQTIAQYEKIQNTPKLETVRRIAEALDVPIYELQPDWSSFTPEEVIDDFEIGMIDHEKINKLISHYDKLNETGKNEAIKRVAELTEISKYTQKEQQALRNYLDFANDKTPEYWTQFGKQLNAAHARTDIEITPEERAADEDMLDE